MSLVQILPSVVALNVVSPSKARTPFLLRSDHSVFIGTSVNCGLTLGGEGVADIHCYIRFEDGKLWVEDWMSKTGTLINGTPITTRVEVELGDVIQVGPNRIVLQDTAQTAPPPVATSAVNPSIEEIPYGKASTERAGSHGPASHDIPAASQPVDERLFWTEPCAAIDCFDISILEGDDDETYDKETVALLRAEIEHLQAALARRDAQMSDGLGDNDADADAGAVATDEPSDDAVLARMQELIEEANRSDERVAMLEELLLAAESANSAEQEERIQLEAWIDDIEQRLAQREEERQAEVDSLHERLLQAGQMQERLVQQLRQTTGDQAVPQNYHEHLEQLQRDYQKLQHDLAESQQQRAKLQQRLSQVAEEPRQALREERVRLAEEQKLVAKFKLELSSQLNAMGACAELENRVDAEADHRIKALRDHLLQIHEQEQRAAKAASLAGRLKKLWQRVDG